MIKPTRHRNLSYITI